MPRRGHLARGDGLQRGAHARDGLRKRAAHRLAQAEEHQPRPEHEAGGHAVHAQPKQQHGEQDNAQLHGTEQCDQHALVGGGGVRPVALDQSIAVAHLGQGASRLPHECEERRQKKQQGPARQEGGAHLEVPAEEVEAPHGVRDQCAVEEQGAAAGADDLAAVCVAEPDHRISTSTASSP